MSQVMALCTASEKVACGNCGWEGIGEDLNLISDFEERVYAGETVPAGQCPMCSGLAYLAYLKEKEV